MPKPVTVIEVSKTEIVVHKRGSSARYLRENRAKRYYFKEIIRLVSGNTVFPLYIDHTTR